MKRMKPRKIADPEVSRFVREKLDAIKREYSPSRLIVFGSRAVGSPREESDIDVIVVSEQFRGVRYPIRMGQFLIRIRPHVHVDALCYTPEEFDEMLKRQSPFVRMAVATGIHIV